MYAKIEIYVCENSSTEYFYIKRYVLFDGLTLRNHILSLRNFEAIYGITFFILTRLPERKSPPNLVASNGSNIVRNSNKH